MEQLTSSLDRQAVGCTSCRNPCSGADRAERGLARARALWGEGALPLRRSLWCFACFSISWAKSDLARREGVPEANRAFSCLSREGCRLRERSRGRGTRTRSLPALGPAATHRRQPKEKADPRSGSGDCLWGRMVCFKAIMISKPQSCLASKRSRHQRSDGDCALRLGTPRRFEKRSRWAHRLASWTVASTGEPRIRLLLG